MTAGSKSRRATLAKVQMDSSPTDPTVSATVLISLFQNEFGRPENRAQYQLGPRGHHGGALHFSGQLCLNGATSPPAILGLDDIAVWEQWFRNAHEQILRDSPDPHLVEQERAKIEALATAIAARMRSDYLARTR